MTDNYTQDFIDEVKGALNSGSSGGGTIDQTARDDISKHASDSEIHVTTVEKASWNGKAELTDIPTTLPANGGNADTVDGLHASDIQIDSVSDTAGIVTLDGLQGGVPFSDITVSGKNLITEVLPAALGGNSTDGFRITDNPYCRSFVQKLLPNTTYTVKRYDDGNRFRIILFNEYPTITADTTANQILNATTTPSEFTFTTGSDHLWFALSTHNGAADNTTVEPIVQLEYGDTATEYEPPIIRQEITLTACGKNLIPYPYPDNRVTREGISFVANADGTISMSGTATQDAYFNFTFNKDILLKKGIAYTLSTEILEGSAEHYGIVLQYINASGDEQFAGVGNTVGNSVTFVPENDIKCRMWLRVNSNKSANCTITAMLEAGNAPTEYAPYNGSVTTITPDSNPYTVPNDIRQQDGVNNVSVSAGEITVSGVKKSPAINRAWEEIENKISLSDIPDSLPANGGDAATLGSHPASDFVLKSDYDALAARVAALEARTTE